MAIAVDICLSCGESYSVFFGHECKKSINTENKTEKTHHETNTTTNGNGNSQEKAQEEA